MLSRQAAVRTWEKIKKSHTGNRFFPHASLLWLLSSQAFNVKSRHRGMNIAHS